MSDKKIGFDDIMSDFASIKRNCAEELKVFGYLTTSKKFVQINKSVNDLYRARKQYATARTDQDRDIWYYHCDRLSCLLDGELDLLTDEEVNKFIDWFVGKVLTQKLYINKRLEKIQIISTFTTKLKDRDVNIDKLESLSDQLQEEVVKL